MLSDWVPWGEDPEVAAYLAFGLPWGNALFINGGGITLLMGNV